MPAKVSKAGKYLYLQQGTADVDLSGDQVLERIGTEGLSGTADFSGCTALIYANLGASEAGLTSVTFDGCTALQELYLSTAASLTSLDLTGCAALDYLESADLTTLAALDLSDCVALTALDLAGIGLTTIDLTGLSILEYAHVRYCPSMTSVTMGAAAAMTDVSFQGCALTESAVDAVLAALDSAGLSNGEVNLSAGTNSIPSAAGLTSKSNLEGKGWTVTVNT